MNPLRVRYVDIEGDVPGEVAEVIEKAMRDNPRADVEQVKAAVLAALEQGVPTAVPLPIGDDVVQAIEANSATAAPADEPADVYGDLETALYDAVDEEPPVKKRRRRQAKPIAKTDLTPVREWYQIPEQHRAWNAIGSICHIALDPTNPTEVACGHELGMLRDPKRDPLTTARPCAACNRALDRARRNDT